MVDWRLLFIVATAFCVVNGARAKTYSRSTVTDRVTRYKSLLLDYFATPRHPYYNGDNCARARAGIVSEFEKILHNVPNTTMEIQPFETAMNIESGQINVKGQNIIVTFGGRNRRTARDSILVIGAHYDSDQSPLLTIDDNGSGVVAMLEVARELADAIVNRKAVLHNTIIFVAFDIQLLELSILQGGFGQPGGSRFYVAEKLAPILTEEPKPEFLGAIILDSVMNYNDTDGSQILPNGFEQSFPEGFAKIKANSFKGNYLTMVTKEKLRSLQLDYAVAQIWNKTDTKREFPMVQLEVRRMAASPALFEFLKQDHVAFWNHVTPLSAVLLTDTSKWRGVQQMCGSSVCNSTSLLTPDRLDMLDQVVLTLNRFISESQLDDTISSGSSIYTSLSATFLTLLAISLL